MIWRVALAVFLTACISWFALGERPVKAQFNGCPAGFCSPAQASSCSATLALDGGVITNNSGNSYTITLSTTNSPDVIIVGGYSNNNNISGVSSSHVSWNGSARSLISASTNYAGEWEGIANAPLSNEVITLSFSGGTTFSTYTAFGISGANTSSPFDSNVALPATTTTTTPPSVSTSNANDFIYSVVVDSSSSGSPGSGFNAVATFQNFSGIEYVIKSATQSGLSMAISGDTYLLGIGDAVKRSC
jgi:hypothetical protein